jgi:hypothetical protein
MEVLRNLRPLRTLVLAALALAVVAAPAEAQRRRGEALPAPGPQWPVKTREHVDLWFHVFALMQDDTAKVPFFERGYRERITIVKNSRSIYTKFDEQRAALIADPVAARHLLDGQFLALNFGTWPEMKQAFEYFLRAEGNPRNANNREVQAIVFFLAQRFPKADDRAWVRKLVDAVQAEYDEFYKAYWLEQFRAREPALARADSLWQNTWRPGLQRFLNYTQQNSGDLILSITLGGEGRALPAGDRSSQYAVAFPATADSAEVLLFAFVHEAAGSIARVAVSDNLTPAQQRSGIGAQLESNGLVRGGALLAEQVEAGAGERYARWYLAQTGKTAPEGGALAALAEAFPMPDMMIEEMKRQIALSFQGI